MGPPEAHPLAISARERRSKTLPVVVVTPVGEDAKAVVAQVRLPADKALGPSHLAFARKTAAGPRPRPTISAERMVPAAEATGWALGQAMARRQVDRRPLLPRGCGGRRTPPPAEAPMAGETPVTDKRPGSPRVSGPSEATVAIAPASDRLTRRVSGATHRMASS